MGSPYLVNGLFLLLPLFYRSGATTCSCTRCRFPAARRENSPFSGYGYFASGMTGFAEAMGGAVYDFPHDP